MTEHPEKPDVESLIADIQKQAAEAAVESANSSGPQPRLEEELQAANQYASAGQGRGLWAMICRRLLRFLVDDINRFQAASVRSLNLLAKRVQAVSGEGQAQVFETVQRTEAKQVELEKRIHAMEEKLKDSPTPP